MPPRTPAGKVGPRTNKASPHRRQGQNSKRDTGQRREIAGLEARAVAVRLVTAVLDRHRSFDDTLQRVFAEPPGRDLQQRDRGLARLIAATALRRRGQLEAAVSTFLERPLPDDRGCLTAILLVAAGQLLLLGISPHAVINIAVEQCRHDRGARRFAKLANAVLRRISEQGAALLAASDPGANFPEWMISRWISAYGADLAGRIVEASLREAALDLTVKSDPAGWAERLGGTVLPTGTVRLTSNARVADLPGYTDGAWWVQDAAAALPARLLGNVRDIRVADLCAAPGGKTAQLAAAGALVTAVDAAESRVARLRENLQRLKLQTEVIALDVLDWRPDQPFDAVLLDAPCTATGTIRRHPDIIHLKRAGDLAALVDVQARLLDKAFEVLRPGGTLVYCTCSLEPEEGYLQIERFLARQPEARRRAIDPAEIAADPAWITPSGDLRTLPCQTVGAGPDAAGLDGFYAARLERLA
jgi:16S rRNA (cytosine967-C5)-methyltransferase